MHSGKDASTSRKLKSPARSSKNSTSRPASQRLSGGSASLVDEIAEKSVEESREIARLKGQVRSLTGQNRELLERIDDSERRLEVASSLQERRAIERWEKERKKSTAGHSVIVALSDWHWEEVVVRSQVAGVNEYTPEIAHRRAKHTFQKTAEYWERYTHGAKELVVGLLGDFITGFIHEELEETNALSPMQATLEVMDVIQAGLQFLSRETDAKTIMVPCCFGNHSRTTKKRRVKTEWRHSYEYAMYERLEKLFAADPKIKVFPARGYLNYVEVQGRTVRFHHGHAIKYGDGVGGITIPVNKRVARWDRSKTSHLDVFGHFHSIQNGEGFRWICNGSLIGQTEYSADCGYDPTPPKQAFIVFDGTYGVRTLAPIISE